MHRFGRRFAHGGEFHLPHREWVRLLRENGFEFLDLLERRPPKDVVTRYAFVTPQ